MLIVPDPNCQGKLAVRNEHWVSAVGTSRLPLSSHRSSIILQTWTASVQRALRAALVRDGPIRASDMASDIDSQLSAGASASGILRTESTWMDIAMEMKVIIGATRIVIEEFAQDPDNEEIIELNKQYSVSVIRLVAERSKSLFCVLPPLPVVRGAFSSIFGFLPETSNVGSQAHDDSFCFSFELFQFRL